MKAEKISASNIYPGCTIYMVQEKNLFPDSDIKKADVKEIKVVLVGFGPNGNEDMRDINNGDHVVKVAGNPDPDIGDIVFDQEVAKMIWGRSMENTIKAAEAAVTKAKRDLEAALNYREVTEKTLSKKTLGFEKEGTILKVVEEKKSK